MMLSHKINLIKLFKFSLLALYVGVKYYLKNKYSVYFSTPERLCDRAYTVLLGFAPISRNPDGPAPLAKITCILTKGVGPSVKTIFLTL